MTNKQLMAETPNTASIPAVGNATSSEALRKYRAESKQRYRARLDAMRNWLRSLGVASVLIEYDGSGDCGQIEKLTFRGKDQRLLIRVLSDAQHEEVEQFFYDLLESRYGGWENDEGAYGDFEWNLMRRAKVTHQHYEREITSIYRGVEGL